MKNINSIGILGLLLSFAFLLLSVATNHSKISTENNIIVVLVKYKTLENKANEALNRIGSLINFVKQEPHFVNIKILIDPKDSTNILLYEEWADGEYYTGAHIQTDHLQNFILNSRSFLAGPPDISMWHTYSEFK